LEEPDGTAAVYSTCDNAPLSVGHFGQHS